MKKNINTHIENTLDAILNKKISKSLTINLLRISLPYKLIVKDSIVKPINRDYKPLCLALGIIVDYDSVTEYDNTINDINVVILNELYLYTDGTAPWNSKKDLKNYIKTLNNIYGGLDKFLDNYNVKK
jgi:hypothetical protein